MIFGPPLGSSWVQNGTHKLKILYKRMKNRDAGLLLLAFPAQTDDAKAAQCAHGFHFHDIDVIFKDLPSIWVPIFALAARRATATNNQKLQKTFRNLYNEIA